MRLSRVLAGVSAALALALAGCATEEPDVADGAGHNEADVAFATDMIRHHAQALSMVDLTMGRDLSPELVDLAEEIRQAQAPEIEQMVDWLVEWEEPVPETSRDHANAHADDHGESGESGEMSTDMPGMMSAEQMTALEDAPDARFEELWLSMMIEHHQGAVTMAEEVRAAGESEETAALAEEIIDSQQAEIERMQAMLAD